ncbi:MAG: hypothetical protein ACPGN7_05715 [Nitrosopumilus sp.]
MSTNQHPKHDSIISNSLKQKMDLAKHLKENNTTYKSHWWRAMSMSMALFIHAWIPSLFPTYASDKMNHK